MKWYLLFDFVDAAYIEPIKNALIEEGYTIKTDEGWHCWGLYIQAPEPEHLRARSRSSAARKKKTSHAKRKV